MTPAPRRGAGSDTKAAAQRTHTNSERVNASHVCERLVAERTAGRGVAGLDEVDLVADLNPQDDEVGAA